MTVPNQIVFIQGKETYFPDGRIVKTVAMRGFCQPLPAGMKAHYTVTIEPGGEEFAAGYKQARSIHGKRYTACRGWGCETTMQAELLKWATRILRERAKEVVTDPSYGPYQNENGWTA